MATKKKVIKPDLKNNIEPILKALNMSDEIIESESKKGLKIILEKLLESGYENTEIVNIIREMIAQY